MATMELTEANFGEVVDSHAMVILDFWAPWCAPCRMFGPIFEQVSELYPDILFGKINTEVEQVLAGHFQIRSIPTLMVVRDRVIIFSQPGALQKKGLEEVIAQAAAVDMAAVHSELEADQASEGKA